MYGFPSDLNLLAAVGHETTQFCIGPYDLQFSFGPVAFAIQSRVELQQDGGVVASWQAGEWPGAAFYSALSKPVSAVRVVDERRLCIALQEGLELHVLDTSEQYESLQIYVQDVQGPYII
jgi:hypothetical protein